MSGTIYRINNLATDGYYIGSAVKFGRRKWEHLNSLKQGVHHCRRLQEAYAEYGPDAFEFEVLQEVEDESRLLAVEDMYLGQCAADARCYNTSFTTTSPPSYTEETRRAISETLKARFKDPTTHPRYGKTHSAESRAKISDSRTGKMAGEKHYRYGQTVSAEVREKIGAAQRGVKKGPRALSEEGRAKIKAAAAAGHYASFTGKHHTEEAKAKMSRPVQATSPEGTTTHYPSITALRAATNLLAPTINRALKSGLPLAKGPFRGWTFKNDSTP